MSVGSSHRAAFLFCAMLTGVAALTIAAFPAQAEESCSVLEKAWRDRYVDNFRITWDTTDFSCPGSEGLLALTFHDLESIKIEPNRTGHRPDFYQIVTDKIKKLRFDKDCTALAHANRAEGRITLCPPYFKDSREDRVSTLLHEARHLDPDAPLHVHCAGGRFIGHKLACDETFYNAAWEGSGFNADVFFLGWTLRAGAKNELSQAVMQSLLNSYVPDRFNNITAAQIKSWRTE